MGKYNNLNTMQNFSKVPNPNLTNFPEKVCRACYRIVMETGGVKYQSPKKVMEEWSKNTAVNWVPKCSKKEYLWEKDFAPAGSVCYQAVPVDHV